MANKSTENRGWGHGSEGKTAFCGNKWILVQIHSTGIKAGHGSGGWIPRAHWPASLKEV